MSKRKPSPPPVEVLADGTEINPYIPTPWYATTEKDSDYLQHQRSSKQELEGEWYDRGAKSATVATKYRKGACTNCGSMSHKAKDCLERPRKVGAKYSGLDIKSDDVVQDIKTTWDSKRDRWNGYDATEYKHVVKEYEVMDDIRKRQEEEEGTKKRLKDTNDNDSDSDSDSDSEAGEEARKRRRRADGSPGIDPSLTQSAIAPQAFDQTQRVSTRTLRVREDKPSYLNDLKGETKDEYNPKSRTLWTEKEGQVDEKGQYVRYLSGIAREHEELRRKAEGATEKGESIHLELNPTAAILRLRELENKRSESDNQMKRSLMEKYGGEEYLNRPKETEVAPVYGALRPDETDKGSTVEKEKSTSINSAVSSSSTLTPVSKYPEDVHPGNHNSVWGSYWYYGKWGFNCCHSLTKNSYCYGESGREINDKLNDDKRKTG